MSKPFLRDCVKKGDEMELESVSDLKQQELQNSVQIAVHKKSMEIAEQDLKLLETLPQVSNPPGVGGNVDLSA